MRWIATNAVQLSVRAAAAATLAVVVADTLALQAQIYAMISAVIVTDLEPKRTRELAFPRILGTILGTMLGGAFVPAMAIGSWMIGIGVLATMLVAHVLGRPQAAKLAGYVCGIVMLTHAGDAWTYAWLRFVETLIGIASAVVLSFVPKLLRGERTSSDRGS